MATFDDNIWYRIKSTSPNATAFSYDNDNNGQPDGFVTLSMQPTGNYAGQLWQITTTNKGYFQFCASWFGPDYRMGYWKTNASQPTYYTGLFNDKPRRAPSQQWEITPINGADGGEEYAIINQETSLYMDLGASRGADGYEVYLGGQEASEVWTWEITVVEQINNASYSPISSTISASATSLHGHSSGTAGAGHSSASASGNASPADSHQYSSHFGLYVGIPVAIVFALVCALGLWCILRRRKRRRYQTQEMSQLDREQLHPPFHPFSTTSGSTAISPLTPGDFGADTAKSPTVQEYYSADSPAFGKKDSQEISGTPVAEMESRGPEQKATERLRSPLAEPRQGHIRGVAELE